MTRLVFLFNSLPDYDQEISVFDYYVDESGEWDLWQSRYGLRYFVSDELDSTCSSRGMGCITLCLNSESGTCGSHGRVALL